MKLDTEIEIKNNPKLKDKENEAYESLKRGCDVLVKDLLDTDEIIVGFNTLADKMYNLFKNYDINIFYSTNPTPEILKRWLNDPDKRFYWYIFSAILMSTLFDKLETYSRYPMLEFSNNNITILNSADNKFAIDRIYEIISEMVKLVPIVWKQVDSYKTSLQS
jgi:hypothetical protein